LLWHWVPLPDGSRLQRNRSGPMHQDGVEQFLIKAPTERSVTLALDCNNRLKSSQPPIKSAEGGISGCVLVFKDVTERRRLEKLNASHLANARILASIVESSDDAIISKSLDGIIQSWNAAAERMFGYSAEQAVGRHISLIIPPDRLVEEDRI